MSSNEMPVVDIATVAGFAALAALLAAAVYLEIKESRIPNWLTLSGMAFGLLLGYLPGGLTFRSSLIGLLIGFGFLFIFYMFGGVGGGDVKLMGAAGALLGSDLIQPAICLTALIGAAMAVIALIWRRDFWTGMKRVLWRLVFWRPREEVVVQQAPKATTIPYGVAIAAGCLAALYLRGI